MTIINLSNICFKYKDALILHNINLKIKQGEFVILVGENGSGKTTLLKIINRLLKPYSGTVFVDKCNLTACTHKKLLKIRKKIGYIPQDFGLLERASVLENALLGRLGYINLFRSILGIYSKSDINIANRLLNQFNIADMQAKKANELSGGQQQRLVIARALCQEPSIILADEPLAHIDRKSRKDIVHLFARLCEENNTTIIATMHSLEFIEEVKTRIIGIEAGQIIYNH